MIGTIELTSAKIHQILELQKPSTCFCQSKGLNISLVDFWERIMHPQEISIKYEVVLFEG